MGAQEQKGVSGEVDVGLMPGRGKLTLGELNDDGVVDNLALVTDAEGCGARQARRQKVAEDGGRLAQ